MATRWEMSRGAVWELGEETKSFMNIQAAKFEVRYIAETQAVVIVGQDGVSGLDEDDADGEPLGAVRSQIVAEAGRLLNLRWRKGWLINSIVSNPEFVKGNFKACIRSAYESVDEEVEKFVEANMDKTHVRWDEPYMWRAFYNSFVVIVTGDAVYTAGLGSFCIKTISSDGEVLPTDYIDNRLITDVKSDLAYGMLPHEFIRTKAENLTMNNTCWKYELQRGDRIVVEQIARLFGYGRGWTGHGQDWEAAINENSLFQVLVLDLDYPDKLPVIHNTQVEAPVPYASPPPKQRPCRKRKSRTPEPGMMPLVL